MNREKLLLSVFSSLLLFFACHTAGATIFKCVDSSGKSSYQDTPCASSSKETEIKAPPPSPVAPANTARQAQSSSGTVQPSTTTRAPAGQRQMTAQDRENINQVLGTWNRFNDSLGKGDKKGALNEMTPSAREKYAPVFDALGEKKK